MRLYKDALRRIQKWKDGGAYYSFQGRFTHNTISLCQAVHTYLEPQCTDTCTHMTYQQQYTTSKAPTANITGRSSRKTSSSASRRRRRR